MYILLLVLWMAIAIPIAANIAPYASSIGLRRQIIVIVLVIIGAPIMLLAQSLELLLDNYLEEGWNSDDEDKFGT